VFFKTKIKPGDFANCLVRDHRELFGLRSLDDICKLLEFHFRDEPSYIEAFYELQAYGLYSIAFGVRAQCGQDLQAAILTSFNKVFADISGPNWEMMCRRVKEYEELSIHGPTGGFAAQRIFDKPPGVIQPSSKEAFGLALAMNESCIGALEAVKSLFKQYRFDP
jgi:hypothetical protein